MRFAPLLALPLLAALAGCEQRGPYVYVLESPQTVVLNGSATPATVQQGDTVVLRVERRTTGQWKKVSRSELTPGQCWVYRPPVEVEPEVAQDIKWQVEPERAVEFHTEYQMDHTRVATAMVKGKIQLTPVSTVKCEEGRSVAGSAIEIDVS